MFLFLSMFVLLLLICGKFQWSEIELAFNTNTTRILRYETFIHQRNFNRFTCIRQLVSSSLNLNLKFTFLFQFITSIASLTVS